VLLLAAAGLLAASAPAAEVSPDGTWQAAAPEVYQDARPRTAAATTFHAVDFEVSAVRAILAGAPMGFADTRAQYPVLVLPTPDGGVERFEVAEVSIMAPELAAKYPDIRTYRVLGVDDGAAHGALTVTPLGVHASIRGSRGAWAVQPLFGTDNVPHAVFAWADQPVSPTWVCEVIEGDDIPPRPSLPWNRGGSGTLRTYRMATACTGEYAALFGGTVPGALANVVAETNSLAAYYEIDNSITFQLVANNDLLMFTNPATDPYDNSNTGSMLAANQTTLTSLIGGANYDIGHVLGTAGGGIAVRPSACSPTNKARGVSAEPNNVFVYAHEVGHQFSANHAFNSGGDAGCLAQRASSASYEPGSGSSFMSYAGRCSTDNVTTTPDFQFNWNSLIEIRSYSETTGACFSSTATGNDAPTVSAGPDFTIPSRTPFLLTASASDPNGDTVRYSWEEADLGPAAALTAPDDGQIPLFRSFAFTTASVRSFPRQAIVQAGANSNSEKLPTVSATRNFRVVARDTNPNGGLWAQDGMQVTVVGTAGPFQITSPNTNVTWTGNRSHTVTWDVANTNVAPINCANVSIEISTNAGTDWTMVVPSTPNDGSHTFLVPNTASNACRIRIRGVGNIFYDINNSNFRIVEGTVAENEGGWSAYE
jgi:hypothetical protein